MLLLLKSMAKHCVSVDTGQLAKVPVQMKCERLPEFQRHAVG